MYASDYLKNSLALAAFKSTAWANSAGSVWFSQHTGEPDGTGSGEIVAAGNYAGYARKPLAAASITVDGRRSTSAASVTFATPPSFAQNFTLSTMPNYAWLGLWDALTAGNYLGKIRVQVYPALWMSLKAAELPTGSVFSNMEGADLGDYLANAMANAVFKGTSLDGPATLYFSIHHSRPSGAGEYEFVDGAYSSTALPGYARASLAVADVHVQGGEVLTLEKVSFVSAPAFELPDYAPVNSSVWVGVWDAVSGGNFLAKLPMTYRSFFWQPGLSARIPAGTKLLEIT